jgi:RND family efflux transporter MFP subunit
MKLLTKQPLSFVVLFICTAFLSACGEDSSQTAVKLNDIKLAKIIELKKSNAESLLSFPAVIGSQNLTELAFEVGGLLNELLVVEAQSVKKGDVIAKLDQQDLTTKLKSAQAQYNNSNKEYKRALRLIKADAISRSELDKRKSKSDIDKSSYLSAQKALKDSVLLAPFDGNISAISVSKRQVLQAGEPAITILGNGGLEAKFNLPSSVLAKANANQKSDVEAYITLDSAPDVRIPASFKEISLQADASSQTYPVTFSFLSPQNLNVLPGMNAVAWFKAPNGKGDTKGIQIPLTAVLIQGDEKFVWLVQKDSMKVTKRAIKVADDIGETLQVLEGVKAGDKIVGAGVSYLSEGMTVRPWSAKP